MQLLLDLRWNEDKFVGGAGGADGTEDITVCWAGWGAVGF